MTQLLHCADGHNGAVDGMATPPASPQQTLSQPLDGKAVRAAADQRPGDGVDAGRRGRPQRQRCARSGSHTARGERGPRARRGRDTAVATLQRPPTAASVVRHRAGLSSRDGLTLRYGGRSAVWAEADGAFDGLVFDDDRDDRDDREVGTTSDAVQYTAPSFHPPRGRHGCASDMAVDRWMR
ncbi:hypothetical protein CXG81DRAFT_21486 [Caulochytrium protostelioides]|uniref:Uncharacterized protein n=1 Tax=Caulochytrium protostelioides TaxID=1555241 RepID=A0A4P9WV37_9FUNG|nr:hypothetical protein CAUPRSCDRAFT_12141 [Caulochytrium protostelioides]RKO98264.1 hypothetical protein CXG81DRAFT_21486 [Caulochytrium protostelioides]|eukprot:RKO98264.1 hypothetical protein CXG81DRAFT_21486 [Caulochytrium protostelioides]